MSSSETGRGRAESEAAPQLKEGLQAVFIPSLDFPNPPDYLRGGEQTNYTPDEILGILNPFLAGISEQGGQIVGMMQVEVQLKEDDEYGYPEANTRTVLIVNKPPTPKT